MRKYTTIYMVCDENKYVAKMLIIERNVEKISQEWNSKLKFTNMKGLLRMAVEKWHQC